MQKSTLFVVIIVGLLFNPIHEPLYAVTPPQLSEILILPEEAPIRIKSPDTDQEIEVSSIRAISPNTQIMAERPVKLLCPDLRVIEVLPGETFSCPPPEREVTLVVEVSPPPPWLRKVKSIRGEELANLTSEEQAQLQQADNDINMLPVTDEQKLFLRVSLYASLFLYSEAQRLFDEHPEPLTDPSSLRLRATIYWKAGDLRRAYHYFSQAFELSEGLGDSEGQALALHSLAVLLNASGAKERAIQKAQEAQQAYAELGYVISIDYLLQPFPQE